MAKNIYKQTYSRESAKKKASIKYGPEETEVRIDRLRKEAAAKREIQREQRSQDAEYAAQAKYGSSSFTYSLPWEKKTRIAGNPLRAIAQAQDKRQSLEFQRLKQKTELERQRGQLQSAQIQRQQQARVFQRPAPMNPQGGGMGGMSLGPSQPMGMGGGFGYGGGDPLALPNAGLSIGPMSMGPSQQTQPQQSYGYQAPQQNYYGQSQQVQQQPQQVEEEQKLFSKIKTPRGNFAYVIDPNGNYIRQRNPGGWYNYIKVR